jgi:hypothetical protein
VASTICGVCRVYVRRLRREVCSIASEICFSMDKYLMLVRKVVRQYLEYCKCKAVCEEDMDEYALLLWACSCAAVC